MKKSMLTPVFWNLKKLVRVKKNVSGPIFLYSEKLFGAENAGLVKKQFENPVSIFPLPPKVGLKNGHSVFKLFLNLASIFRTS